MIIGAKELMFEGGMAGDAFFGSRSVAKKSTPGTQRNWRKWMMFIWICAAPRGSNTFLWPQLQQLLIKYYLLQEFGTGKYYLLEASPDISILSFFPLCLQNRKSVSMSLGLALKKIAVNTLLMIVLRL